MEKKRKRETFFCPQSINEVEKQKKRTGIPSTCSLDEMVKILKDNSKEPVFVTIAQLRGYPAYGIYDEAGQKNPPYGFHFDAQIMVPGGGVTTHTSLLVSGEFLEETGAKDRDEVIIIIAKREK
ncbi:MAG: hypothetical protein HYV47_03570 [Candidatus Nealsonbacteria bacterium]|nr:hypothetical protein [Candidatus Nealsonbacteria bacterium]